jgi:hypothetical protein
MIPEFDPATDCLPCGIHEATWTEIAERFGTGERRQIILAGLQTALQMFRAAGARHAHLGGSFVSAKAEPHDFDGCFDDGETYDQKVLFELSAHLPERLPGHFAPESYPNPTGDGGQYPDFFQADPRRGLVMGVIYLNLDTLPPPEEGSPARRVMEAAGARILTPSQDGSTPGGPDMAQENPPREDLSRRLAERAARDPQFRQQLIDNPRQAVEEELGVTVPGHVEITVLEEAPTQVYVILPPAAPAGSGLSESDLNQVAAGTTPLSSSYSPYFGCI